MIRKNNCDCFNVSQKLIILLCAAGMVASFQPMKEEYPIANLLSKRQPKTIVDSSNCFFDGQRTCESCKAVALCVQTASGFTAYEEYCTETDQVCNIPKDQTDAECTSSPAIDEPGDACFCSSGLTSPTTEPDPFTTHGFLYCNNGNTLLVDCDPVSYIYYPNFDGCGPPASTCSYVGTFPFEDDCSFYYSCIAVGAPGIVYECPKNEYYDQNYGSCREDPKYPYVSCFDNAGQPITGTVPNSIFICSKYGVCDQGILISEESCAVGTEIFSQEANGCIPDDGTCIPISDCFIT